MNVPNTKDCKLWKIMEDAYQLEITRRYRGAVIQPLLIHTRLEIIDKCPFGCLCSIQDVQEMKDHLLWIFYYANSDYDEIIREVGVGETLDVPCVQWRSTEWLYMPPEKPQSFMQKLSRRYKKINSLLCVGLDPVNVQPEGLIPFVQRIIEATKDYALAYKVNAAFFERWGLEGYAALSIVHSLIPAGIPFILDAKRGDIEHSAGAYASGVFEKLRANAITVNGWLGSDGVLPFAANPRCGVFVLCRTSNPSGGQLQNLTLETGEPLYVKQAQLAKGWNENDNIGLVVGATCPDELVAVRKECPDMWILVPGVGAQGGDLEVVLSAGRTDFGGLLINVGRGITEAEDPKAAAREYVEKMCEQ